MGPPVFNISIIYRYMNIYILIKIMCKKSMPVLQARVNCTKP